MSMIAMVDSLKALVESGKIILEAALIEAIGKWGIYTM